MIKIISSLKQPKEPFIQSGDKSWDLKHHFLNENIDMLQLINEQYALKFKNKPTSIESDRLVFIKNQTINAEEPD